MGKTKLMDPTSAGPGARHDLAPRLKDLRGSRGGFRRVWANFDTFLGRIEERLAEEYEIGPIKRVSGTFAERPPEKQEKWRGFQQDIDWAVVGLGTCWGTAPWAVYDAVELERQGKPTVTIATDEFEGLARETGIAEGYPDLPMVVVPHFFEELSEEQVRLLADEKYPEVLASLTAPSPQ